MDVFRMEETRTGESHLKNQVLARKNTLRNDQDIFKTSKFPINEVYLPGALVKKELSIQPSPDDPGNTKATVLQRFSIRVNDRNPKGHDKLKKLLDQPIVNKITLLDLRHKKLNAIPSEIWKLKNLTELNLGFNQIRTLPVEIGELANLKVLHLNNNHLKTLPPEIGQLSNLAELYLNGNPLLTLPSGLAKLPKLTKLNLGINHILALLEMD
ncbi:MAG: leucine-rich repeat domain-containing protein [Desulfobacteraceae bacterium]|nr:leucine-rich repeat domain-containing protein [Desulfobacteraceae bacterium]